MAAAGQARPGLVAGQGPLRGRVLQRVATLTGIHGTLYPLVAAALLRQPGERPA